MTEERQRQRQRQRRESQTATEARPRAGAAAEYEQRHVTAVYDAIAPHFAATRHAPWPLVHAFVRALPPHATLLDIGCGNGKYLRAAAALRPASHPLYVIGADMCEPLLRYAQRAPPPAAASTAAASVVQQFVLANALFLPIRDHSVDAALNIAVVHHLSTRHRRIQALRETVRVLRPGGSALIYVWALERPNTKPKSKMLNRRFETQDVLVPWHYRASDKANVLQPWHRVHNRFYHVYKHGELLDELAQVPHVRVIRCYYDHQNWCVQLEKRVS